MLERHVVRQLTAYCHHELTAAESSRVQQHLEVCESCRREYESIRLAVDLASRMSLQRAPDSLWGDVVRASGRLTELHCQRYVRKPVRRALAALGIRGGKLAAGHRAWERVGTTGG